MVSHSCFNGAITFQLWKSTDTPCLDKPTPVLQWGHNFSVMEITLTLTLRDTAVPLQWGHNFSVMEIVNLLKSDNSILLCFNGAITFQLWKFLCNRKYEYNRHEWLQWGHNFSVMEMHYYSNGIKKQ